MKTAHVLAWTGPGPAPSVSRMETSVEMRQLKAFVALVERGSVTGAAEKLGLAQSTVSESLSALERAVGASVFVRRRGSHDVVLTDAGHALLPHARAMLDALGAAHVAVANITTAARAQIAIATNESLSSYVLVSPLDRVRRAWPNMTFAVTVASCAEIREGVESGAFDLGLTLVEGIEEAASPLVDCTVITTDVPLVLFAQPSHPLAACARAGPIARDALARYSVFLTDATGSFHALVRRFVEEDGLPGPRLQPTGSVDSVKRGVFSDARALGVLPHYALVDEVRAGRVTAIEVRQSSPRMRVEALHSRIRPRHPASVQLLEEVRAISGTGLTAKDTRHHTESSR
jgi:DNA-binding transcriptional LysR family regulator